MKLTRPVILIGALVIVGVGVLGVVAALHRLPGQSISPASIVNQAALEALPQKDASGIDVTHVGKNIIPPTNKWFSGLALQAKPQTVFPTPLSFTPTENSFTFDYPGVLTSQATIMASTRQPLTVQVTGATEYVVTRYDEVSVDLTFRTADREIGVVTLVAGLPYIYYHGLTDTILKITTTGSVHDDTATYHTKDVVSKVIAYDGAHIQDQTVTAPGGSSVTMYAGTENMSSTLEKYAHNRVESAAVTYKKDGDNYRTTIEYKTANGQPTVYGRLPHQQGSSNGPTMATIYGSLTMEIGSKLEFMTPAVPVLDSLDLSKLSSTDRDLLTQTVRQDINSPHTYPDDSYFGGKALYRDAQLLALADQLGEKEVATTVETRLQKGLAAWLARDDLGPRSLYYDTRIHGIVGVTPSFGSEAFNDHHFHYAYFIYAASILARHDASFLSTYKDTVNLLVADIANYRTDDQLPLRRVFDPYFGHSWASGSAPFADGNNQESSSEAINAWIGIALWGQQIGNGALVDEADWLLSNESAATTSYWLDFDTAQAPYSAGYGHKVVSLNWGGKRDYATFFSADPRAMLGIQLIPMSPTTQYMSKYGTRITEQLKEAHTTAGPAQFDDYLLMYESLGTNSSNILNQAKQLPDTLIDGANSRSYMYAWIMSR